MRMLLRTAPVIVALSCAFAFPVPARAADAAAARADAKKHFQRAITLYEEQDYRAALAEFQRAYELAPNYKVLYDIGQTHYQLQNYPKAIDTLEKYLKSGEEEIPRARRVEVEGSLSRLRTRVATLNVKVNVIADVTIDDEPATSQVASLSMKLNAGQHRVSATAKGYLPATKSVNLVGEDRVELQLDLDREPGPAPPPSAPRRESDGALAGGPPPPSDPAPSRTGAYVSLGATAVLGAGAIGFGVATLAAKGTYDKAIRSTTDSPSRIDDARHLVRTTSVVADTLAVAAVAAGITTVVLFIRSSGRPMQASNATACPATLCGTF